MPLETIELDEIFSPAGLAAFVRDSWNRQMLHLPGQAGRFAPLFDWQRLSHLLEWNPLQPPRIELARNGKGFAPERFLRRDDDDTYRLDSGRLELELDQGATLIVNFISELVPELAALADSLSAALPVKANINLYASWRPESGLPLHWDSHAVIILQLSGRKHWSVHAPTRPNPIKGERFEPPPAGLPPLWTGMLEDGDLLYLPRGYPHQASAVDGPSLHLTIGLVEQTGISLLRWLVDELQEHHAELRAAMPMPGDPAADARWTSRVRELLDQALGPHALASYRGEKRATRIARPGLALPSLERAPPSAWTATTALRLASRRAVRLRFRADGAVLMHFAGRDWPCAREVAAALARLSSNEPLTLGAIADGLTEPQARELRRFLALLFTAGEIAVSATAPD